MNKKKKVKKNKQTNIYICVYIYGIMYEGKANRLISKQTNERGIMV